MGEKKKGRAIKQSSESIVTGVCWEQERRKSEYRCYQTHPSHSPVCLFIFSFADCKPPFCKRTPIPHLSLTLSMLLSLKVGGWENGKGNASAIIKAKGVSSGELQSQRGRVKDISLLAFSHSHINHLMSFLLFSLSVKAKREERRLQQQLSLFAVCTEGVVRRETLQVMAHSSVDRMCYKMCTCPLELELILPVYFGGVISKCRYSVAHTKHGCLANKVI